MTIIVSAVIINLTSILSVHAAPALSGQIHEVNKSNGKIIIKVYNSTIPPRANDILFVSVKGKTIYLRVIFPMMTSAQCVLKDNSKDSISILSAGLPVFRDDGAATTLLIDFEPDNHQYRKITMRLLPGGEFKMGADESKDEGAFYESPRHSVIIEPFMISSCEITQAQYSSIMKSEPSWFPVKENPVEKVSWIDAIDFCNRLSEKMGYRKVYNIKKKSDTSVVTLLPDGNGFRLPTEAEWEFAARGGTSSIYYWGNSIESGSKYERMLRSNIKQNSPTLAGTYSPNPYGLSDMLGNVREWCFDWYSDRYYSISGSKNPHGPETGNYKVVRGGGWSDEFPVATVFARSKSLPTSRSENIGFRIARSSNTKTE